MSTEYGSNSSSDRDNYRQHIYTMVTVKLSFFISLSLDFSLILNSCGRFICIHICFPLFVDS